MTVQNNKFDPFHFDSVHKDHYTATMTSIGAVTVLYGHVLWSAATATQKGSAVDYANFPGAGATTTDADTGDWIKKSGLGDRIVNNNDRTYTVNPSDGSAPFVIKTCCTQEINYPLTPVFPLCSVGVTITSLVGLQTFLDSVYGAGNLAFNSTTNAVEGVIDSDDTFDDILPKESVTLSVNAGTIIIDSLISNDGTNIDVVWPDGSTVSVPSGGDTNHVVAVAGDVVITTSGCAMLTELELEGEWTFDIAAIAGFSVLEVLKIKDDNLTFGDIANLPETLREYENDGDQTTTGDIANLPPGLQIFIETGDNTIFGNVDQLPPVIQEFEIDGNNTTSGDIGLMPASLVTYDNEGDNTTFGDIGSLPAVMTVFKNTGDNTTNGDIGNLPTGLVEYRNTGDNTTVGDIANLPATVTIFNTAGDNTTSGDIANLPAGLIFYNNAGDNTVTGDIANLPAPLFYFDSSGDNTIFGDTIDLNAVINFYNNTGLNTVVSTGTVQFTQFRRFTQRGATGFDQASVDAILAGLAQVPAGDWFAEKLIDLGGNNAAPSAAGLASIATLNAAGITVINN